MKKSEIVAPVVLTTPFAASGDKNIIPATNNPSSGDASQNLGFPPVTEEDINAGGIPPTRQDFNGLGYMTSSHNFYNQNGSFYTFSPEVSAAIGGYPNGAILWYLSDAGVRLLQSTKDDNTDNFITTPSVIGTSWVEAIPTVAFVNEGLAKRKLIAFEKDRNVGNVAGTYTLVLQDSDEIINFPVTDNVTITIDYSQLTFPKQYATFQFRFYFNSGAKTIGFTAGKTIVWIGGNAADFTDAKPHWVVLRIDDKTSNSIVLSDAGAEG